MASKDIINSKAYLLEIRSHFISDLISRGFSGKEIAYIFNVHPSQITRTLNKK